MQARRERARNRLPRFGAALLLASALVVFVARPLEAATRVHALVIGNNRAFPGNQDVPAASLPALRYADDDAAAFHELVAPVAHTAELLTVMDGETQRLYPSSVSAAKIPTLAELQAAVARIARRIGEERAKGHRNVVYVFYSGHGTLDYENQPALALFDGGLARDFLYDAVLQKLPADELHLLVDACHAEAVVRPRDAQGEVVNVSAEQANAFLVESTLARFPHVGAIVAATTDARAHEWDQIRHGIFTHELLSALRGAADINRDRRIEYSEIYAFMTAANREVKDVRARLSIVAKPPDKNRRAPLIDLSSFSPGRVVWLEGVSSRHGMVELSDMRGRRLVTLHADREFVADLLLPVSATLYVRGERNEASFAAHQGRVVAFDRLKFTAHRTAARDALDDAVRRGLFAAQYGRRYYDGVVDQMRVFLPVDFSETSRPSDRMFERETPSRSSYGILLGGGLSSGVAELLPIVYGLNLGLRPIDDGGLALSLAVLRAADGPLAEWHYDARAGWLWSLGNGPLRGHAGGMLGVGLLNQSIEGAPSRRSAAFSAGPVFGFSAELGGGFVTWSEIELGVRSYRLEGQLAFEFAPAGWLGGALRL